MGIVIALSTIAGASNESAGTPKVPSLPEGVSIDDVKNGMRQAALDAADGWPAPRLEVPADQSRLWITAWNDMATCYHDRGVTAFPEAPATFGDGHTPVPVISAVVLGISDDELVALMTQCPFDTSQLDRGVFEAASRRAAAPFVDAPGG